MKTQTEEAERSSAIPIHVKTHLQNAKQCSGFVDLPLHLYLFLQQIFPFFLLLSLVADHIPDNPNLSSFPLCLYKQFLLDTWFLYHYQTPSCDVNNSALSKILCILLLRD